MAQTAAWQAVGRLDVLPLPALSRAELSCLGVDGDAEQALRATRESFGLGAHPPRARRVAGRAPAHRRPTPPPPPGAPPSRGHPPVLDPDHRAVLASLGTI